MLMQDAAGDFEVYRRDVASENAFAGTSMGAVGAPWAVDGIAANTLGSRQASGALMAATCAGDGVNGRWRSRHHRQPSHHR